MLRFFEGAISGTDPAWDQVMFPQRPSPHGNEAFTGFLLNIEDRNGQKVYSKVGGSPGFTSQVVLTTDPPALVVLLSNVHHTAGLQNVGIDILDAMEPFDRF